MLKLLFSAMIFTAATAHAATQISMDVRDLKTGKTEAKVTIPIWVAKVGNSLAQVFNVQDEKVDIAKLIAELENQKQNGTFLVIEDHKENRKVIFSLE